MNPRHFMGALGVQPGYGRKKVDLANSTPPDRGQLHLHPYEIALTLNHDTTQQNATRLKWRSDNGGWCSWLWKVEASFPRRERAV